jgi:hypothetical protein
MGKDDRPGDSQPSQAADVATNINTGSTTGDAPIVSTSNTVDASRFWETPSLAVPPYKLHSTSRTTEPTLPPSTTPPISPDTPQPSSEGSTTSVSIPTVPVLSPNRRTTTPTDLAEQLRSARAVLNSYSPWPIQVLRVTQLDAELLDEELVSILKGQVMDTLKLVLVCFGYALRVVTFHD